MGNSNNSQNFLESFRKGIFRDSKGMKFKTSKNSPNSTKKKINVNVSNNKGSLIVKLYLL